MSSTQTEPQGHLSRGTGNPASKPAQSKQIQRTKGHHKHPYRHPANTPDKWAHYYERGFARLTKLVELEVARFAKQKRELMDKKGS